MIVVSFLLLACSGNAPKQAPSVLAYAYAKGPGRLVRFDGDSRSLRCVEALRGGDHIALSDGSEARIRLTNGNRWRVKGPCEIEVKDNALKWHSGAKEVQELAKVRIPGLSGRIAPQENRNSSRRFGGVSLRGEETVLMPYGRVFGSKVNVFWNCRAGARAEVALREKDAKAPSILKLRPADGQKSFDLDLKGLKRGASYVLSLTLSDAEGNPTEIEERTLTVSTDSEVKQLAEERKAFELIDDVVERECSWAQRCMEYSCLAAALEALDRAEASDARVRQNVAALRYEILSARGS